MTSKTDAYKEICANIRESDGISFKLIGLVPALTTFVVGFLTFAQHLDNQGGADRFPLELVVLLLSIGGALIVGGIYKWEMRNVQKCNSLIHSAACLEKEADDNELGKQYQDWQKEKEKNSFGKTQAERLIYFVAISLWIIPAVVALVSLCQVTHRSVS